MRIEVMELKNLNPAPYNPRIKLEPGEEAYERIKKSLSEFGLVEPLVYNERTGYLVGGHQRYQILRDLGKRKAEVSIVDLDPAAEKALNIALNKAQGEWDTAALEEVLKDLIEADQAEAAGFDHQEIEDLILKIKADTATADFEELMGPAVERPDQAPIEERVTVTLRAGPDILTKQRIKKIRGTWAHLGIEVQVERGNGREGSIRQGE